MLLSYHTQGIKAIIVVHNPKYLGNINTQVLGFYWFFLIVFVIDFYWPHRLVVFSPVNGDVLAQEFDDWQQEVVILECWRELHDNRGYCNQSGDNLHYLAQVIIEPFNHSVCVIY